MLVSGIFLVQATTIAHFLQESAQHKNCVLDTLN